MFIRISLLYDMFTLGMIAIYLLFAFKIVVYMISLRVHAINDIFMFK